MRKLGGIFEIILIWALLAIVALVLSPVLFYFGLILEYIYAVLSILFNPDHEFLYHYRMTPMMAWCIYLVLSGIVALVVIKKEASYAVGNNKSVRELRKQMFVELQEDITKLKHQQADKWLLHDKTKSLKKMWLMDKCQDVNIRIKLIAEKTFDTEM